MKLATQQSESFKFYDQNQKSTRDLPDESATCLWLKVFRDVFVEMPLDKYAKRDMISKLKECYHNNNKQLKLIDAFDRTYEAKDALRWYIGQLFIYKQINRTLRTEDIEQLHKFRFFVAHRCACITEEHQYIKEFIEHIIFYRGFLSTNRSKEIAKVFVGRPEVDKQNVLFKIECNVDKLKDAIIFAGIARFNKHPDEQELLFDLGATRLQAADIGEKITREYLKTNRQELNGESSAIAYASLVARIGYYEKALHFYEQLLINSSGEDEPRIWFGIGTIHFVRRDNDQALKYLTQTSKSMINTDPQRVEESKIVLNSLGNLFISRGEYDKAIIHFVEALTNRRRLLGEDLFDIDADIICNITTVYFLESKVYDFSLNYYMEALSIQRTCYSLNHETIAFVLHNIGNCYLNKIAKIYFNKGEYLRAIAYNLQEMIIRKCLRYDKVDPVRTSNILCNIGMAFMMKGEINLSSAYHIRSLHRKNQVYPNGHISVCTSLTHVANLYNLMKQHIHALEYYEKALIIYQKLFPDTYQINYNVDEIYFNMSNIHTITNNLNLAQEYADKSLNIFYNTTHPENPVRVTAEMQIKKIKELIQ